MHTDQIPKHFFNSINLLEQNFEEFIEGFRKEITKENIYRNQKLIDDAKKN